MHWFATGKTPGKPRYPSSLSKSPNGPWLPPATGKRDDLAGARQAMLKRLRADLAGQPNAPSLQEVLESITGGDDAADGDGDTP